MSKLLDEKLSQLSVWELNQFKTAIENNFRRETIDGEVVIDYYTRWSNFQQGCLGVLFENRKKLKKEYPENLSITFGEIIIVCVNKALIDKGVVNQEEKQDGEKS